MMTGDVNNMFGIWIFYVVDEIWRNDNDNAAYGNDESELNSLDVLHPVYYL